MADIFKFYPNLFNAKRLKTGEIIKFIGIKGDQGDPGEPGKDATPYDDTEIREELEEVNEKIKDLELFKYPNVTIVGSPTISHGQVTGFDSGSYLKFPFLVDFHNQNFEINMSFTTGSNVTSQENIFDSDFGLAFAIRNNKFIVAISTNGTSWDLGESVGSYNVQPQTTYYVRLSWNKLQYKLDYSLDNRTFINDISKTAAVQPYPRQIYIGVGENFASIMNHFTGIINLNAATLKINNEVVWAGMDDAGLSTRADVSLSNIDADGETKIKELAETGVTNLLFANLSGGGSKEFHIKTISEDGNLRRVPFIVGTSVAGAPKAPITISINTVPTTYTDMTKSGESVVNFQIKKDPDSNDWFIKAINTGSSGVLITIISGITFKVIN